MIGERIDKTGFHFQRFFIRDNSVALAELLSWSIYGVIWTIIDHGAEGRDYFDLEKTCNMKQNNRFIHFHRRLFTQYLKISSALILLFFSLLSCSGNESGGKGMAAVSDSSQKNIPAAGTGFSCFVDGVAVSGSTIDAMQLQNTAFIYPGDADGKRLLFMLVSSDHSVNVKKGYFFKMRCPDLEGRYVKAGMDDRKTKCHITLSIGGGDLPDFLEDSVIFTITSITSSRLTGSFSGRLTDASLTKHVMVTNGKFDIPFSTGNLRPE